jgi:hypothetical protein
MIAAFLVATVALAQPEPVPPDIILETIRAAYQGKPVAEEVKVEAVSKASRDGRADRFTIRIDPGPGPTPARVFLDLGRLNVSIAGTELTAINSSAPGVYYSVTLPGPPTPRTLAKVLPPIPAPQLAFACRDQELQRELTPYTAGITWANGAVSGGAAHVIPAV